MVLLNLWNIFIHLLISSGETGIIINGNEKDIIDAVAGERFIIRTWTLNGSNLSINIKKHNRTRLNAFIDENTVKHQTIQNGQLILKYNHTIKEVSLMLNKVSMDYEGVYQIEESFNRTIAVPHETETKTYQRRDGRWSLELNVLGPHEVIQSYVGENITMVFEKSSELSILHNYDQQLAILAGSLCGISTLSHLCGRVSCGSDEFDRMYKITIKNVTQLFAGLYRLVSGKVEIGRYFLSIKDNATRAVVGDNAVIGWFYNQQGMNRAITVTHPKKEVMMLVPPNNIPEIKSNFKHRLLYSGDASKNFMLFTLLNVKQSDAGVYTIETLHGNTIPGCKELIVKDKNTINVKGKGTSWLETVIILIVIIGSFGVVSLIICCLIWIRRKNTSGMEPEQTYAQEECGTDFYLTPVGEERPLPIPLVNGGRKGHSDSSHNPYIDSSLQLLHMTPRLCMSGYETVDTSNNDDPTTTSCKDNTCKMTESINTHILETSGYLTVLGAVDTSV